MANTHSQRDLDQALLKITNGFYLVTSRLEADQLQTQDEDWISAATISWLMQSSFDPPMITLAVQRESDLNETILNSKGFSVVILGKEHQELIDAFQSKASVEGDTINGIRFSVSEQTMAPLLETGIAWFDCKLEHTQSTAGDHMLLTGRVVDGGTRQADAEPLFEWETRRHYGGVGGSK